MTKSLRIVWYSVVAAAAVILLPAVCLAALIPALPPVKAIELPPPNVKPVKAIELKAIAAREAPYGDGTEKFAQLAANTPPVAQSDNNYIPPSQELPQTQFTVLDHSKGANAADYNPQIY